MLLLAVGWPGGSPENTGIIIGVVFGAYFGALWLAAILWTIRDIRERSHDPITQIIALVMVVGFSLAGWALYMVLRPRFTLAEVYERQLEEEALLQDLSQQLACPQCGAEAHDDYVACPQCATRLKEPCHSCQRALALTWRLCPWCGTTREPPAAEPVVAVAEPVAAVAAAFAPREAFAPNEESAANEEFAPPEEVAPEEVADSPPPTPAAAPAGGFLRRIPSRRGAEQAPTADKEAAHLERRMARLERLAAERGAREDEGEERASEQPEPIGDHWPRASNAP